MASHLRNLILILSGLALVTLTACSGKILKYEKSEKLKENVEFQKTVKIEIPEEKPVSLEPEKTEAKTKEPPPVSTKKSTAPKSPKVTVPPKVAQPREPKLESDKGFIGRRPIKDPFWVGEKVVHSVRYLAMNAGFLTLEVKPFATVNGKKSYNFQTSIKTGDFFSSFYSVDDYVNTLLDYETLVPSVFTLHVKESAQLRESQAFFDNKKLKATFWEKKVTKKKGEEEKKIEWDILPYSQNVFSAVFYLRVFQWDVGVENSFRIADAGDNLVFKAKALRREEIETPVGKFKALVIKPEIELKGAFKPTGDNYIWISDDDRKLVLRIESKIKIGTLVSEIISLNLGQDPEAK